MRRILRGWNGLDRYTSVLEHGGADDVSIMAASPSAIHVPAGIAGRNGAGQRALGSAGHASGCSDGAHVLLLCADPGTFYNPAASAYYAATGNGAGGGSRLIGKFVIASLVKEIGMKKMYVASLMLLLACSGLAIAQAPVKPPERRTIQQVLDRAVKNTEQEFVSAADAMPEDKYSFAPTNGEFKGVRNFGEQVKHVAAVNYEVAAAMIGEKPPVEGNEEKGPDSVKSKADILNYLKDSFAYVHKAVATIDEKNVVEPVKSPFGEGTVTRLGMATLTVGHCMDHYGQMVEYLRMNGIIPPASR